MGQVLSSIRKCFAKFRTNLCVGGVKLTEPEREWLRALESTVLHHKCNLAMAINALFFFFMMAAGHANFQRAEKVSEARSYDDEVLDLDASSKLLPFARTAYIIGSIGRVVLMLASVKLPVVCKAYHAYDQLMLVLDFCMV